MMMRHWRWLDDGILPLCLTLMRACWLWPWLALLQSFFSPSAPNGLMPLWLILALPLSSLTLAHYLIAADSARGSATSSIGGNQTALRWDTRLLMAATGLVAILIVIWLQWYRPSYSIVNLNWLQHMGQELIHWSNEIPAPFFLLLTTAALWLTGLLDAAKTMSHDDIWRGFGIGFSALVLYLLIMAVGDTALTNQAIYLLLLFFGVGMAALAFSSTKIISGLDRALGRGQGNVSTGNAKTINRYWLLTVGVVIVGLLGLGLLLALLIAPDDVARLWAMINSVLSTLWYLVSQVILFVSYLIFMVFYYIALLLKPLFENFGNEEEGESQGLQPMGEPLRLEEVVNEPTVVPDSYRWASLAALTIALLLIFALALRRLQRNEAAEQDEVRESILSADLLQSQLSGLFGDLLGRVRSRVTNPFLSLSGEDERRQIIRGLYQQLLTLGQTEGVEQPRQPYQTPYEYAEVLGERVEPDAVETLTGHYLQARYGGELPTSEDVVESERAWEEIGGVDG